MRYKVNFLFLFDRRLQIVFNNNQARVWVVMQNVDIKPFKNHLLSNLGLLCLILFRKYSI